MKGIILAGGSGTRLYPITLPISKQLLPVYDKPMIYYPLSTLMMAGMREILIITTPHDAPLFKQLLGDGSQWGITLVYAIQAQPNGIAEAFIVAKDFIGTDSVCLMLGDNILYGQGLIELLNKSSDLTTGAHAYCYYVKDPERYGVAKFDNQGNITDIVEKPKNPPSNYAVIGMYFFDHHVSEYAARLEPSDRGELEITDLLQIYLDKKQLSVDLMGRGIAWLDTGTHESLLSAAQFFHILEERQALKIGCPEEIAWRKNYINEQQLRALAEPLRKSGYGDYLLRLIEREHHYEGSALEHS